MHELSLANSIIENVKELAIEEHFTRILSLTLSVGALSGVDGDSLEFCLIEVAKGTILENAKIIIEKIPIKIECNRCKKSFFPENFILNCPYCHSLEVSVISGKEFNIKNLEVVDV